MQDESASRGVLWDALAVERLRKEPRKEALMGAAADEGWDSNAKNESTFSH